MSELPAATKRNIEAPRMLVMGVGSSGARAVEHMRRQKADLETVAIDTDTKVLEKLEMGRILHVGATITRGMSAGGDVELGRQAIEKDSSGIRKQLRQVDLLILVAGLGGGTGSGAVPVITRIAREAGALVLVMVSLPFAFEGKKIAKNAEDALQRIRTHADAIIRIPNERLIDRSQTEIDVDAAFSRSHQVMNDGIFALWRLLSTNGVCGLDFACIHTMLHNCDGFCHFASAVASGKNRAKMVTDALLEHRLLAGGKLLANAVGVLVGLTGGRDLQLSEVETVMNTIEDQLPAGIWMNYGVVVDQEFEGRLSVIVLLAEQWKEPLVESAGRQAGWGLNRRQVQGELPLETVGKGEFTYVDPTIYNNQDLDVPTYIRRDIKLPR